MSRLLHNRFALPALVVLALGALSAVAWASRPGASAAGKPLPRRAQVTTATRICPLPAASSHGTRIAVYSAPGAVSTPAAGTQSAGTRTAGTPAVRSGWQSAGQGQGGQPAGQSQGGQSQGGQSQGGQSQGGQSQGGAQLAAVGTSGPPLEQMAQPGRLWLYSASGHGSRALRARGAAQAPVAVRAGGSMASGLEVEESSRPQGGSGALTGMRCPEPGTDFWFAGPGQAGTGAIELYLINPDSQAASADVDVYTDSGPLQGSADTGLTVPPGGRLVQAVDRLIPGSRALALHVRTTAGRVVAAVQAGGAGNWLPATGQPATAQVIPGLPAGGGGRRLYLADPGGSDAEVNIQAVTPTGEYEPTGGGAIDVPSGSATSVDLPSMDGIPAALRVTANVPVAAGLEAGGGYDASAAPIGEQSVAADNAAGHGYSTTLVLSAPAAAARVSVATGTMAGPGRAAGQVVTIPAGHSTNVKVGAPRGGASGFAIVVTPLAGSGPVYAARVLSGPGGAQTIMPMMSAPSWVALPEVAGSLTAVMP